jgi:toxin ParE1/3/4
MEIIWRRVALRDLASIYDYIAQDNPAAATRVRATIRSAVASLSEYPHLGRAGRVDGTRELIIGSFPYIVAYRVVGETVRILAVIHTSRQWPRRF